MKGSSKYDCDQERDIPCFTVRFKSLGGKAIGATFLKRETAEAFKANLEKIPERGPVTIEVSLQTQWFVDNMVHQ